MGTSIVKRYVFAPMDPCFAYTLEEVPYRRNTTLMLEGICKYMLTGLAKSVTYDLQYEQGRVHRLHVTWRLILDPEQDQTQHAYALSHFYRKLGWLETKNFNDSWRLFDMDDPYEVAALEKIAAHPCVFLNGVSENHAVPGV